MPKPTSLAKPLLKVMEQQKLLLQQLERLAPQPSDKEKPETDDLIAALWKDTLEILESAVEDYRGFGVECGSRRHE